MAYRDPARQGAAERKWYRENRQRVFEKKNRKKAALRAWVRAAKDRPCTDCGHHYPYYVMDFDHVSGEKVMDVSAIANRGGTQALLRELAKCEVVCANCHRTRSWERQRADDAQTRLVADAVAGDSDNDSQLTLFETEVALDLDPD